MTSARVICRVVSNGVLSGKWLVHLNIRFNSQSWIHSSHSLFLDNRFFLVFLLFFPGSYRSALELYSNKSTHFERCDSDGDNSGMICLKIYSCLTENEGFPISTEMFLNGCSSWPQSTDNLFKLFCLNNFVSVQIILILLPPWVKSDLFFYRHFGANIVLVIELYLKIRGSAADRSPCERFVSCPIHTLKPVNCTVDFGRVMSCHRFSDTVMFWWSKSGVNWFFSQIPL
jgi:hypothetical protein